MKTKRFNISLPAELVDRLDTAATKDFVGRSAFIREAIDLKLSLDDYVERETNERDSSVNMIRAMHYARMRSRSYSSRSAFYH